MLTKIHTNNKLYKKSYKKLANDPFPRVNFVATHDPLPVVLNHVHQVLPLPFICSQNGEIICPDLDLKTNLMILSGQHYLHLLPIDT